MILGESQPFASPDEALAHYGKKGMKWGIRNEDSGSGKTAKKPRTEAEIAQRKARAKKAAIGAGALLVVAGGAFVAYKMHQSGNLPLSSMRKATPKQATSGVKKILQEPTTVIHASRGKDKGYRFFKQGGTPDYMQVYERAFGIGQSSAQENLTKDRISGLIAAAFKDPEGRADRAGRSIIHEVIVPKSMSAGIESVEDVKTKIWPLLKDTYDAT